jgi:hydrogenase maturation protein HypF
MFVVWKHCMIHARISVSGQVQGVGFRPFVYRLAHELGVAGWVRNDNSGVEIAIEGERDAVMRLIARLQSEPPRLARVERVEYQLEQAITGVQGFCIAASQSGPMQTAIAPDMAICPDCLAELFDPTDRRYLHPFINCIHCGPRYTLTASMPYDRANTSMAKFAQCPACQHEYDDPATRRFHAQPNACPVCGPQLRLYDSRWQQIENPVETAARLIRDGQVVAIKGVGGFHLAFDAKNAATAARLRGAKRREEMPFAVMALNTVSAGRYAQLSDNETFLLNSSERPIVLLQKTDACDEELPGIAPGLARIGLLLPYTPLHYLLFHELSGKPCGTDWLQQENGTVLVMTSANPGGEPLVLNDVEARESLAGLADACLTHDRDILQRCDDSVMRVIASASTSPGGGEPQYQFIRRARGYTPRRILLPYAVPSVLACGGWLKNTVCITRGNEAFVSQHIGDLDCAGARAMLDATVAHLCDIYDVQPEIVAHDMHPDFYSSEFALDYAAERGLPVLAVQHHHAHIGAVCAEHHITTPVLGLGLDGVGLGTDGGAWGGELLQVDGADFQRLGHLAPMAMPGGDRAAKEPWRMAAAALFQLGRGDEISRRFSAQPGAKMLADMLQRDLNCPQTSSMGRLFDAAAGLLGISEIQRFEGQAAMLLEGLAAKHGQVAAMAGAYSISDDGLLDFGPLLSALADCRNQAYGAALFHACLANGLTDWVLQVAYASNIDQVALGGGCFHNHILSQALMSTLSARGLHVLTAQQLPPNDGGISLGQAWIAGQSIASGIRSRSSGSGGQLASEILSEH